MLSLQLVPLYCMFDVLQIVVSKMASCTDPHADARRNAEQNGIDNAVFQEADLDDFVPGTGIPPPDVVIAGADRKRSGTRFSKGYCGTFCFLQILPRVGRHSAHKVQNPHVLDCRRLAWMTVRRIMPV